MKKTLKPNKYFGITHDVEDLEKWKKEKCSKNIHCFDEVWSVDDWYLYCDACELVVKIKSIYKEVKIKSIYKE